MKTVVAMPMKDPAESKTRLAGALTAGQREQMALALFRRAQTFFATQFPAFERLVVTPSPRIANESTASSAVTLMENETRGLNRAAQTAFMWAKTRGGDRLLVVPADIPIWLRSEMDELLEEGRKHDVAIARAHDGGTNALLINLRRVNGIEFCYGPDSAKRHADAASAAGVSSITRQWPFLGHDIDTAGDCLVLSRELFFLKDAG
ncbi:2-phospho-L-lactate guanylyltransferase [Bradyrhizobium sp. USDA 4504]